jgi:dihydrofolate reductase
MGIVFFYMTVSLDGFIAGPDDDVSRLFRWYFSGDTEIPLPGSPPLRVSQASAELIAEYERSAGAGVVGRHTFDVAGAWGGNPPGAPLFVLTHDPPADWIRPGSPFVFVTDGIASAVRQARVAAGDKDVQIWTGSAFRQALQEGLVDEIHVALAPVLLGTGTHLYEGLGTEPIDLEIMRVVHTPEVTHLRYRVVRPAPER